MKLELTLMKMLHKPSQQIVAGAYFNDQKIVFADTSKNEEMTSTQWVVPVKVSSF